MNNEKKKDAPLHPLFGEKKASMNNNCIDKESTEAGYFPASPCMKAGVIFSVQDTSE